jgi:hypothetical protein
VCPLWMRSQRQRFGDRSTALNSHTLSELSTRSQQVVGQRVEVVGFAAQDDNQRHVFAALPEGRRHALLGQQLIRVGYRSEPVASRGNSARISSRQPE